MAHDWRQRPHLALSVILGQFSLSERRFSSQNRKVIRERLKFGHFFARETPLLRCQPLLCDKTVTNRLQPRKYSVRRVVRSPRYAVISGMAMVSIAARS